MMSKGVIVHLENEKRFLEEYQRLFASLGIDLDYIGCLNITEFKKAIKDNSGKIKSIIFDLVGDKASEEELARNPEFLEYVREGFAKYNLPIFIYSGHLDILQNEFEGFGTVFTVSKDESIQIIFDRIKLFLNSGFVDVFSPGGILETELHKELHQAFIQQFKNSDQIIDVINLIQSTSDEKEIPNRTIRVFKRIAIRSLLTEMLSPEVDENGEIKEEFVGITEHYVNRINNQIKIWTGDIFKHNESDDRIFILMPRCNAIRCEDYLVCAFFIGAEPEGMKADKVGKLLTGDPTVSGYDRYLPVSPVYQGGRVALSRFSMKSKEEIIKLYGREISLSDELTNEVLGKFAAYFFRTGITPWNVKEGKEEYKSDKNAKK